MEGQAVVRRASPQRFTPASGGPRTGSVYPCPQRWVSYEASRDGAPLWTIPRGVQPKISRADDHRFVSTHTLRAPRASRGGLRLRLRRELRAREERWSLCEPLACVPLLPWARPLDTIDTCCRPRFHHPNPSRSSTPFRSRVPSSSVRTAGRGGHPCPTWATSSFRRAPCMPISPRAAAALRCGPGPLRPRDHRDGSLHGDAHLAHGTPLAGGLHSPGTEQGYTCEARRTTPGRDLARCQPIAAWLLVVLAGWRLYSLTGRRRRSAKSAATRSLIHAARTRRGIIGA